MTLNQVRLFTFAFIVLTVGSVIAVDDTGLDRLTHLFTDAQVAVGPQYVALRNDLLAEKDAAPFLTGKLIDTNVVSRVLARAMISWSLNSNTNSFKESQLRDQLGRLLRIHGATFVNIARAFGPQRGTNDANREVDGSLFLEISLKGATAEGISVSDGSVLWFRCLAITRLVKYEDPDTIPLLTELLRNDKEAALRAYALAGLQMTRSLTVIEQLIAALPDESKLVRDAARYGLKDLTGQDFGTDQAKYRDWWNQNKERLLKNEPPR